MNPQDNSIMPAVKITLGGRERNLVFDFNAQAAFELATGFSVFDKKVIAKGRPSPLVVRAMLWAQLLHEDPLVRFDDFGRIAEQPELTIQAAGRLITKMNVNEVSRKVYQAFNLFFKEEKPDEGAKKNE